MHGRSRRRPVAAAMAQHLFLVVATAGGLLPERIDLTHIFSAYGAGTIIGDAVAVRWARDERARLARRYGVAVTACALVVWLAALIGALR